MVFRNNFLWEYYSISRLNPFYFMYFKVKMNETISLTAGTNLLLVVIITLLGLLFVASIAMLGIRLCKTKRKKYRKYYDLLML